jgi:hypothetical protein
MLRISSSASISSESASAVASRSASVEVNGFWWTRSPRYFFVSASCFS